MPAPNTGPRKAIVKCSECGNDVEVTLDKEENRYSGICSCGWNMGEIYTKFRAGESVASLKQPEPKKKKSSIFD